MATRSGRRGQLRRTSPRRSSPLLLSACAAAGRFPVRIGVAGSFSDPIGLPMKLAAELAAEEINATGGINGRPLELVTRDDYADPDSAVFVANDLYESDVSAVVGHLFSGTTLAAAPVYNGGADPVAAISPSSSSPEVTTAGDYTFRVCPSDLAHGAALAHWVRDGCGLERGAVLYLNDQYGRGIRQTFVERVHPPGRRARRRSIPTSATSPTSGPTSTGSPGTSRSEFLVVAGNRGEAEEILRQARTRGLTMPVLGGDGLEGIEEAGASPRASISPPPTSRRSPTDANRRSSRPTVASTPTPGCPTSPPPPPTTRSICCATSSPGPAPSRQAVRRALAGSASATPPFEGVTGIVAFDAAGDVPNQNVYIGLVRDGTVAVSTAARHRAGHDEHAAQPPQPGHRRDGRC